MEKSFKVNNFDLIRLFAATQVLIFHTLNHLHIPEPSWTVPFSYFPGVPIFYTISGYLISASYERSSGLRQYFQNRFLRIVPGLWGCLLITIVVASIFGYNFINKEAVVWLISQMFGLIYTPGFLSSFGFGSYNGSLWTIAVEVQFYLMLPVVYFLMTKAKSGKVLLFVVFFIFLVFAILSKIYLPGMGFPNEVSIEKLIRYTYLPHFYLFLAGVIMQRMQFYKSDLIYGKGLYWLIGYIGVKTFLPFLEIPVFSVIPMLLLAVCTISVSYTAVSWSKKIIKGNDISYGIYIYHGLILNVLVSLEMFNNPAYLWIVAGGAYVLGYLSWIFIEKPFLLKKKQTIHNELTPEPASSAAPGINVTAES